ncbi:BadF/BadG/BcrA/BcrD ATPase family protein [Brachybacterium tyrofermentans]|uniref:BadF/BadG/BcrA/BcrD ATPase family protein n=1 Tax=Brachybacterium tyrofermentans TaxID=47848 RepID=UPI003FD52E5B
MVGAPPQQPIISDRFAVIDAGKSTLRAAVFAGDHVLAHQDEPGGLPHPHAPGAQEIVLERVERILSRLGHAPYRTLVLAATGVRSIGPYETRLRDALAERLDCEVLLENDVVAAYLGVLGPRPGVLVQAGTGSVVLAVDADHAPVLLDGWGHVGGDRGSGYALARAGIREAFSALDGLAPPTTLTCLLLGEDPELALHDLYSSSTPIQCVAALAPKVLQAASGTDRSGAADGADGADGRSRRGAPDAAALAVVTEVADELVATVLAAGRRLGDPDLASLPVVAVGGLFANDLFRDAVAQGLRDHSADIGLSVGDGDALQGALLLATTRDEPITRRLTTAFRP